MVLLAMVNRIALADRNQESKRHKFSWWWWSQFESNMKFILILHHYICAYRYNGYRSPFAILITASDAVQKRRSEVLSSRGVVTSNSLTSVHPSQRNLLETGSGRLSGGVEAVAATIEGLNASGSIAGNIMTLFQNSKNKTNGRMESMAAEATAGNRVSHDVLKERYKEATQLVPCLVKGMVCLARRY